MKLLWNGPHPPMSDCPYDNVEAPTPFGTYQITWKSWKDHPNYSVEFGNEFVTSDSSLEAAKESAQVDFDQRLSRCA